MPIKIIIADDHDVIREGIKKILQPHSEFEVAAEARNGEEAKEVTRKFKPDVILLDITMPEISGLDIIEQVRRISPSTKIVIISVHKTGAYVLRALRLGVNGYINKDNVVDDLIPALRRIMQGGVYLGAQIAEYLAETVGQAKSVASLGIEILTEREQDVLRLVAEGKTAKEIARVLYLSRRTVENYKNSILKKLNLHKTSDMIKYAIENKIVDL
ncbi:response regulator [Candidatus Omnitrophota bacterium]